MIRSVTEVKCKGADFENFMLIRFIGEFGGRDFPSWTKYRPGKAELVVFRYPSMEILAIRSSRKEVYVP